MSLEAAALPEAVETLRRLVLEQRRQSEQLAEQLQQAHAGLIEKALEIEKLKAQLAKLRRMTFGHSSEKLDRQIEQLELMLGDLEESVGQSEQRVPSRPSDEARDKPVRRPLPDHLPREEVVHAAACSCPSCGGDLRRLGEDVTEILEYRPGRFHVIRHLRPKFSCPRRGAITQPALPAPPTPPDRPAPGLLAPALRSQ